MKITVFKDGVLHVPRNAMPRVHPNGMIQLDLNPEGTLRLHVWERVPISRQVTETPIHDHAFDLSSFVLYGVLRNFFFKFQPCIVGERPTHVLHRCEKREGEETCLVPTEFPGYLELTHAMKLKAGDEYSIPSRNLHWAYTLSDLSLTLVERFNIERHYRPVVAVPVGAAPDNDFRRDAVEPEELWKRVDKALFTAKINFVKYDYYEQRS